MRIARVATLTEFREAMNDPQNDAVEIVRTPETADGFIRAFAPDLVRDVHHAATVHVPDSAPMVNMPYPAPSPIPPYAQLGAHSDALPTYVSRTETVADDLTDMADAYAARERSETPTVHLMADGEPFDARADSPEAFLSHLPTPSVAPADAPGSEVGRFIPHTIRAGMPPVPAVRDPYWDE